MRDEHLQDREDLRVCNRLVEEEVHVVRPDLREDVRLELQEYLRQDLDDLLGFSRVSVALKDGERPEGVLKELGEGLAVGWWGRCVALPRVIEQ